MRTIAAGVPLAVVALALLSACAATHQANTAGRLDEAAALALAVDLANAECDKQYSARPFDTASYPVVFLGERWHWGEIDPAGPGGYSATVSFDAFGEARRVEVAFHVDKAPYDRGRP